MNKVNKKKVIIFSTNYFPFVGGAEVAIKEITDRVDQSEFSFDMIVPRYTLLNKKFERVGNINVHRVGVGVSFDIFLIYFLGYWKVKKLERENHYEIIWSMMASQASIVAAKFKKKFPNKKLVLTLQEGDEEFHLKRYVFGNDFLYKLLIRPFHMKVFKVADHITVISNYLADRARENNPNVPITLIPNGVDARKFNIEKDVNLRNSLGIQNNEKIVMTISRLVKKNGIEDLIDAVTNFPENTKLVIVGDGSEREALKLKVKSLKLKDRVIFIGKIDYSEVPRYLSIADVFVRPSLSEGQGIAFLEAMAASVPVVATQVGGIVDFLKDGETGLFCDVNDPKSIANGVNRLLTDADLVKKIVANTKHLIETEYSWDNIAPKMKEALEY